MPRFTTTRRVHRCGVGAPAARAFAAAVAPATGAQPLPTVEARVFAFCPAKR